MRDREERGDTLPIDDYPDKPYIAEKLIDAHPGIRLARAIYRKLTGTSINLIFV
jgi:hypothetical protein